ncbi:hypothetical protein CCP3SC15_850007 [Gammaproteobacteria bacterium]
MERLKELVDLESLKVWGLGVGTTALTVAEVNSILTTAFLIGTVVYTWRRALRARRIPKLCQDCMEGRPPAKCPYPDNARPAECPHE